MKRLLLVISLSLAFLALASAAPLPGLQVDGTRFTYQDAKVTLRGILVKPEGKGPFPAILISHGMGSDAGSFGLLKAKEFAKWGFVCIAPDYTHGKVNDPKKRDDFGASRENIQRALQCLTILESLPDVDKKRICAYGNSMGAFLTVGLAAEAPQRLAAAAITAGGVVPKDGFPAPSVDRAAKVRTPFCILHGTADTTVPAERSARFKEALDKNQVASERHLFEGVGHNLHADKASDVYQRIRDWFVKQKVLAK